MILLRHGHSEGNLAGVFSGWLDVPLSPRGQIEAERAGRLLLDHGCAPTAVHSSVLGRSVATAEIVAGVLADAGLPYPQLARTWRLNERHYGILQGRSRSEVLERFGESQVHRWRRAYREAPPPVGPDDPRHPATDPRYAGLAREQLPGTESLADVLARVTEYWSAIAADLRARRTVLVVAHSNSLRALCVLLDGLGEEEAEGLNLPTGVPLRYVLDSDLRPRRPRGEFLDPDAAAAGIAEVVAQGQA